MFARIDLGAFIAFTTLVPVAYALVQLFQCMLLVARLGGAQ